MVAWVQKAITQWQEEGIELNQGASTADIEKAEDQIEFIFPNDFKELYLYANGFSDYEWRNNLFSIWSLERIISEYNDSFNGFVGFCDYSICVFSLGFDKNKSGIYRHYFELQREDIGFVSISFEKTIDLLSSDSKLLY